MKIIDLHCDTIHKIFHLKEKNLFKNTYSVDIQKLQKGNAAAQFFALFLDKDWIERKNYDIYTYTKEFYEVYRSKIQENEAFIHFAMNYNDLVSNIENGKISAFLTIEEGEFLQGKIDRLKEFYDLGLRLITLTWNYENCIGFPNSKNHYSMKKGLKKFGFEVVERMNDLGMIIDVSHLSDGGFYDVISHTQKPVIASHSNAREIQNVPRNMSDDMIRKLADVGGVMGINFYPHFLNNGNKSKIGSMVNHIEHIKRVGGIESIALGTDFDGIEGQLEISNIGEIERLFDALKDQGMKHNEIEKISWHNAARIIRDGLN
ncbi:MAG: dipeptidase [Eubacteriales bacterium]